MAEGVRVKLADWRFCDLGSWNCANIYNFKFQVLFTLLLLFPSHSPSLAAGEGVSEGWEGVQLLFKVEKSKLHNTSHEGRGEQQWPKSRRRQRNDRQNQHAVAAPLLFFMYTCSCVCVRV